MLKLSHLNPGQEGKVKEVLSGIMACKILTHGIMPQKKVTMIRKSPFGDAFYIKMDNYQIGLRKEEADQIVLEDTL